MSGTGASPPVNPSTHTQDPLAGVLGYCWPDEGPLAEYLRWAVRVTDANPKFHLASILPVFAHEAVLTHVRSDQAHQPLDVMRVHTCVVGHAGSSKSTAQRMALRFYGSHQARVNRTGWGGGVQASGTIPGLWEAIVEKTLKDIHLAPAILYHDEVSSLLRIEAAEFLCQAMDGQAIERHLRTVKLQNRARDGSPTAPEKLQRHAICSTFATTFASLQQVTSTQYTNGGLFSRPLWFVGHEIHHRLRPGKDPDAHQRALDAWQSWEQWIKAESMTQGAESGTLLTYVRFPEELYGLLEQTLFQRLVGENRPAMIPNTKRGLNTAVTLASLFALNRRSLVVDAVDLDRAVCLVDQCLDDYESLLPVVAEGGNTPLAKALHVLRRILRERGQFKRTEAYAAIPNATKALVNEAVETLEDEGVLETVVVPGRGRPATVYRATKEPTA